MSLNRREFLKSSVLSAAAWSAPLVATAAEPGHRVARAAGVPPSGPVALTDTNVHVFAWPFRHLKYSDTAALVAKLRRHGVRQAWAGTFEGLLAKDIAGANVRLADECQRRGEGLLVPFGSVNPLWPDWEEDLRRCHEVHRMPGIRLHPGYQGYSLDHPEFARLLELATERQLLVQIALELEDPRVQHPQMKVPPVVPGPLTGLLRSLPRARVQLLGSWSWTRHPTGRALLESPNVVHDISGLEGVGAVGRMLSGEHWYYGGRVALDRLLFGSHAPYFPVEATLLRMFEAPLTRPQMEAVMAGNAQRLLART